MKITEAIILAGGLGTRLRDAVPDLPKCMAPVAGRPFLFYVINELRMHGIERIVFSLGYKHEAIEQYLASQFAALDYTCVIEDTPLGTGGAIRLAIDACHTEHVAIANGDTLFRINLHTLGSLHEERNATCTLALKPMHDFDRYGVVELGENDTVIQFNEKQFYKNGNINGGLYILDKSKFLSQPWPDKFSFEKDFLEKELTGLYAQVQDEYFIDIGIPHDFERAQLELQQPPLELSDIDQRWTLFLDRDGVINEDKDGSYIFSVDEFHFTIGAPALFKTLHTIFRTIVIVTNQRGVGRNLMTEQTLGDIHSFMKDAIAAAGGHIDNIYYCTSISNQHPNRKPNPGMALLAQKDFPVIDYSKSIMVGNNLSDMAFGRNAGMYTVFVKTTRPDQELPHPDIDLAFDTLQDFEQALQMNSKLKF